MYPTLIEDINDGTVDHDYDIVEIGKYRSVRREAAAALDVPATMTIQHQETGTGLSRRIRTNVRFDTTVEDADGNQAVNTVSLVLDYRPGVTTEAQLQADLAKLQSFLGKTGFVGKLTNLEI
jgi:hypothetical protein